jgi:energy-coupling factor transport system ATP-binding protein
VDRLTFAYAGADAAAVSDVSLSIAPGEVIAVLGPSGSGKSTLLRALAGLVPHFHGGRFVGRVVVDGRDTRDARPASFAGTVSTVFQDPEDQVVMTVARNEVAFGLENLAVDGATIWPRVDAALSALGAASLGARRTTELSGGELQRVCLASALAMEPRLLLLDEPTSQLDPDGVTALLRAVASGGAAVVLSEHRLEQALRMATRVLYLEEARLLLDAPVGEARAWLAAHRPAYTETRPLPTVATAPSDPVVTMENVWFAYGDRSVLSARSLAVRRGEIVALEGPNGSGKSTLAKLAVGLLAPQRGQVRRVGRAGYLSQDPGRYLARERVLEEVALGIGGDEALARAALERVGLAAAADLHPRDLSSGERERLAIAAVAAGEPDLLVLDEPTRGVDPVRKAQLVEWIADYAAEGRGVLVATHDRAFPAHRRISLAEAAREEELVAA